MSPGPRIALEPRGVRDHLAEAIRSGGGEVVEPEQAEAIIWADHASGDGLGDLLAANPGIAWVQLPYAGIEPMLGVLDRERTWTSGKGVYAEPVAEHALALTLAGLRHIAGYARRSSWSGPVGHNLLGARVTVLGAGGITDSLLRLLRPFGCEVTVLRRSPEPVPGADRTATLDELDEVLAGSEVVILALALTDETEGIIDAGRLARMPDHAWLVNVARGRHVVTNDLVDALRRNEIGGAALDVTDPEPLGDDHPLWSEPNCLITPHIANTPEMGRPLLARRVSDNVARFARGEDLLGVVDVDAEY